MEGFVTLALFVGWLYLTVKMVAISWVATVLVAVAWPVTSLIGVYSLFAGVPDFMYSFAHWAGGLV